MCVRACIYACVQLRHARKGAVRIEVARACEAGPGEILSVQFCCMAAWRPFLFLIRPAPVALVANGNGFLVVAPLLTTIPHGYFCTRQIFASRLATRTYSRARIGAAQLAKLIPPRVNTNTDVHILDTSESRQADNARAVLHVRPSMQGARVRGSVRRTPSRARVRVA